MGKILREIKIIPTWREKKITRHPCYNIQPWLISWNICCCRVMLVWQTIDDRVWYWQWTLKNYISTSTDGPCWRNGQLCISVGDINQIFRKWLLFLKPDIIVAVPEGRCCCSIADVEYCCWVAEVIYCS